MCNYNSQIKSTSSQIMAADQALNYMFYYPLNIVISSNVKEPCISLDFDV